MKNQENINYILNYQDKSLYVTYNSSRVQQFSLFFFYDKSHCLHLHAPTCSLMFESPLSERKTDPTVSGAVNIAVEFYRRTRGEYHTLSYRVYRGVSSLPECIEGATGGKGSLGLLLLRGVTSRLISFHFLSFHPRASMPPEACVCCECKVHARVHVWASCGFPGGTSSIARKNDAVVPTYVTTSFLSQTVFQRGSSPGIRRRLRIWSEFIQSRHYFFNSGMEQQ